VSPRVREDSVHPRLQSGPCVRPLNLSVRCRVPRHSNRIVIWLVVAALCSPYILMAWYPETFTSCLRFVLHYHLELALPLITHGLGLWVVFQSKLPRLFRRIIPVLCVVSVASFAILALFHTDIVFWAVTLIGCTYVFFHGKWWRSSEKTTPNMRWNGP
jgi:hypothetical protein